METPTKDIQRNAVDAPQTPPNQGTKMHSTMAPSKMSQLSEEQKQLVKVKLFLSNAYITGNNKLTFKHGDVTFTLQVINKMRWTAGSFDAPAGQNDVVVSALQGSVEKTKEKIKELIQLADDEIGHGICITSIDNAAVNQLVRENVLYRSQDNVYSKRQPRAETAQELNRRCVWLSLKLMNVEIQLDDYKHRYPTLTSIETLPIPNQLTEEEKSERQRLYTRLVNDKKRANRSQKQEDRITRIHEFDTDSRRKLRRTQSVSSINTTTRLRK